MGEVSRGISNITKNVTDPLKFIGDSVGGDIGKGISGLAGAASDPTNLTMLNPLAAPSLLYGASGLGTSNDPKSPTESTTLADLQKKQLAQAQTFRAKLPDYQKQNRENLTSQANEELSGSQKQLKENNASRGLLYGGMNAGQQGALRSNSQTRLAGAVNQSNMGLNNAADTMDQQALSTAYGVQQSQQAAQNQAYSQAMAQMNSQNAMMGSAMSAAMLAAMI